MKVLVILDITEDSEFIVGVCLSLDKAVEMCKKDLQLTADEYDVDVNDFKVETRDETAFFENKIQRGYHISFINTDLDLVVAEYHAYPCELEEF